MAIVSLEQILIWTGGRLIDQNAVDSKGQLSTLQFANISTDTRAIQAGDLFLALRGIKYDAHEFLALAVLSGATGLVVDERYAADFISHTGGVFQPDGPNDPQIENKEKLAAVIVVVQDTLSALQAIANGYRRTLKAPVIGITGSVGKTTTRGMIAACLQPVLTICQTPANNNNEIGVPKTLLSATPQDQAVILEMGMRGRGEIELLSKIAQPDIAVITNVGLSHIERLGSQTEIFLAKAEIIAGLQQDGLVILNADDPHLLTLAADLQKTTRLALISLNPDFSCVWPQIPVYVAESIVIDQYSSQFILKRTTGVDGDPAIEQRWPVSLPQPGRHLVSNALFGFACADELGVDLNTAAIGAFQFSQTGNRQRIFSAGPLLIMDDSYNASPESMLAALDTLRVAASGRRLIAALGGMLELGDFADQAHYQVGEGAARAGFAVVLALGPQADSLKSGFASTKGNGTVESFSDQSLLIDRLLALLSDGDALLVKGSRGFAMERVTAAVLEKFAPSVIKETGNND